MADIEVPCPRRGFLSDSVPTFQFGGHNVVSVGAKAPPCGHRTDSKIALFHHCHRWATLRFCPPYIRSYGSAGGLTEFDIFGKVGSFARWVLRIHEKMGLSSRHSGSASEPESSGAADFRPV